MIGTMPTGPRPAPPAGTARVAISGTTLGHSWVNVFYLQLTHTSAVTVNDLQTIADGISTAWAAHSGSFDTECVLTGVDVTFIPTSGTELRYVGSYSHAGTSTVTALKDVSANFVVDYVISDYYRGGHPRSYLSGVPVDATTDGANLTSAYQSGIVTNWNAIRNAINALTSTNITGTQMGTVRFSSGHSWLTPPRFVPFTSVKIGKRGKIGSQRRRILN